MTKTFAAAIFEAEKHPKKAAKHAALSGLSGHDLKLVHEALNPYRVFNIKKFDWPTEHSREDHPNYHPFFQLLDKLHDRVLTGNAAKEAVTNVLSLYTAPTAKALARVLDKDLKCGATDSTLNKIYPNLVPTFDVMLADKMPAKHEKNQYKWVFPCIAEAKYDGKRMICFVEAGKPVVYRSRNGKPFDWVEGMFDADLQKLRDVVGVDIIVDGEVLAVEASGKTSFTLTGNAAGADNKEAKLALRLFAFDWMTVEEWKANACPRPQARRSITLESLIKQAQPDKIIKSKYRLVDSIAKATAFYEEMLDEGFEGLIIKDPSAMYEWDRGGAWTKWKPVYDVDLTIVGFYEGDAGTKNEGKLGGMNMVGRDENGNEIVTDVGGFKVNHPKFKAWVEALAAKAGVDLSKTNKDQFFREYVWQHKEEFLSKTATVEYQELSLAAGATAYALRFPQFLMIRDDK